MDTMLIKPAVETLPDFDRPDAGEIGDEILLDAASKVKTAKVHGARGASRQSADSRAWTIGGGVD